MDHTTEKGEERRMQTRVRPHGTTSVWLTSEGVPYRCIIEDISSSGVRLRADEPIPSAAKLKIEHAMAGRLDAECKWQNDDVLGLKFHQPIDNLEQVLRVVCMLLHPDDPNHATARI